MRVLLPFVLLGTIAMTLYPVRGRADPVTEEVKAKANEYVNQGLAAQSTGDYDGAIGFYSRAYQLVPHPALIFNIAQAHRLAGRIEQALALYERYLDDDPGGSKATTARELIAEIKARKAEDARKAEAARNAGGASKPEGAHEDLGRSGAAPATADPPHADPVAAPGHGLKVAGLVTGSAGLLALAVGTGFGLQARSLSNELSQFHGAYSKAKEDAGHRDEQIAIAGWVGGVVLAGVGALLYSRGYTKDKPGEALTVAPLLSGGSIALILSGSLP